MNGSHACEPPGSGRQGPGASVVPAPRKSKDRAPRQPVTIFAMEPRPSTEVAVVMRRERIDNRWQPWRWILDDVVAHEPGFGGEPRLLHKTDREELWLHPGFKVELFRDDAEGYYLNAST